MSSQSAVLPNNDASAYLLVSRDASDITRQRKEFLIYNEKKSDTTITPGKSSLKSKGNAQIAWIPQGNQFRLSYLYGKSKCLPAGGGVFNLDGPLYKS